MKHIYSILFLLLFINISSASDIYKEANFTTASKFIRDACLSENGKVIICTDNESLKAFSVENKDLLGSFRGGHRDNIICVAISPDGRLVASGSSDSTVVIWDFYTQNIIKKIQSATGKISSMKFSPDNKSLLFGCSNSKALLYNIKEQTLVKEFTDQKLDVTSVAFSTDGNIIAIAGGDKIIRLYNTSNYHLDTELKGHTNWIRSICFYKNNQCLISGGDDKNIFEWNLSKHKFKKIKSHNDWILCIDITNDGNLFAIGTMSGSIKINYIFGVYNAKLNSPISKVIFIPKESGLIEIAVATLGSGLMHLNAVNMILSK